MTKMEEVSPQGKEEDTGPYRNGLSGFLDPEGVFLKAPFMGHRKLAWQLVEERGIDIGSGTEIDGYIKFGCYPQVPKEGNGGCHVFMGIAPTPVQLEWLKANEHRCTDIQYRQLQRLLRKYEEGEE